MSSVVHYMQGELSDVIIVNVKKKRLDTILKFSKLRKIGDLTQYLELKSKESKIGIPVYGECRKRFPKSRKIHSKFIPRKRLRSSLAAFSWKTNSCFCGKVATVDKNIHAKTQYIQSQHLLLKTVSLVAASKEMMNGERFLKQDQSMVFILYIPWHVSKSLFLRKK